MRVLFTTGPIPTHLNLLVPTAWALRTAGHEVCVASSPDLREAIKDAGLPAVTVGRPADVPRRVQLMASLQQSARKRKELIPNIAETDPKRLTWSTYGGRCGSTPRWSPAPSWRTSRCSTILCASLDGGGQTW